MDTRQMQAALLRLGFNPGTVDGIPGRRTGDALRSFQKARGLSVDGVAGPATMAAIERDLASKAGGGKIVGGVAVPPSRPPWLEIAYSKKGLHEVRDRGALMIFLRGDGRTLGDPAKLPWCGDFVETCIAVALPQEPMVANPYWAQNWSKFGRQIIAPGPGAILVFVRPGGGHVGFYVGEDATHYSVLGGNQSNAITIARIDKKRCTAVRWPSTYGFPPAGRVTASIGAVTTNEA